MSHANGLSVGLPYQLRAMAQLLGSRPSVGFVQPSKLKTLARPALHVGQLFFVCPSVMFIRGVRSPQMVLDDLLRSCSC
jgi:hypothetical protein